MGGQIAFSHVARSESKGTITTKELSEASALKDSIDKALKTLETKNMIDEQSKCEYETTTIMPNHQELTFLRTS